MQEDAPNNFTTLLILSEIFIPLIVFIGVYFIFKPVFGKKKKDEEESK